jgi:hypothetical protein
MFRRLSRVPALCAALIASLVLGCSSGSGGAAIPPPGGELDPPAFQVPADGSTIEEAETIAVSGEMIEHVMFDVDGAVVFDDSVDPYEWTLDPTALSSGQHSLTVTAVQDGVDHTRSLGFNIMDPAPPPTGPVRFVAPTSGMFVSTALVLNTLGAATTVRYYVDGALQFDDSTPPFRWTLDPASFTTGDHTLRIEADHAGGTALHQANLHVINPDDDPAPASAVLTAIQNLQPGEWYEIANTKMRPHAPSPEPGGYLAGIIGAWNSGAYDTRRQRLIVWGGGHGDYAGNEVYVFSMKTFTWERLNDPSPFPAGDPLNGAHRVTHDDGSPVSRHTYEYIDYVPQTDRFICCGGAALWYDSFGDPNTHLFDFDTLSWSQAGQCPSSSIGAVCAVAADGRVWQHGSSYSASKLTAFNPTTGAWTSHVNDGSFLGYYRTAEIDPVTYRFFMIGDGDCYVFDLANPDQPGVHVNTSGPTGAESSNNPGVAFDPKTGKLVCWAGGSTVYMLDPGTYAWTSRTTTGVNTSPPSAAGHGTYGRWRYVPTLNVFVVVNSVDANVFVYRHAD